MNRSFVKGSLVGGIAGAVVAAGTVALASTTPFVLGTTNTPDAPTAVVAQNKDGLGGLNGKLIQLTNKSTGSAATALGLNVAAGRPPLIVNSATKVGNLNADKLDGLDSTSFLPKAGKAADSDKLDGLDSSAFVQGAGQVLAGSRNIAPDDGWWFLGGGHVLVQYLCPADLSNPGQFRFWNNAQSSADVWLEHGAGVNYTRVSGGSGFLENASPGGDALTYQVHWDDGVSATIFVSNIHVRNVGLGVFECAVRGQALVSS